MPTIDIFNLPFEDHLDAFGFGPYRFSRADGYQQRVMALQHILNCTHEFTIPRNTGGHSVTGTVEIPADEPAAILPFEKRQNEREREPTALDDCLLLLSMFEKRDIFARHWPPHEEVIIADSRVFPGGGILRCSIPYAPSAHPDPMDRHNKGYIDGLNRIYELIRSVEWQEKYRHGAFLLLVAAAMRPITLTTRFSLCWTAWEHLFFILNQHRLSRRKLKDTHAADKIASILADFDIALTAAVTDNSQIKALVKVRNDCVHFGMPQRTSEIKNSMLLFTELTEFVTARILNLSPNNVLNTNERLAEFLTPPDATQP